MCIFIILTSIALFLTETESGVLPLAHQATASASEVYVVAPSSVVISGGSRQDLQYTDTASPESRQDGTYASHVAEDRIYHQFASDYDINKALENRLYFSTIPHEKLVLRFELTREANGLPRHLLESIRPFHPFFVNY